LCDVLASFYPDCLVFIADSNKMLTMFILIMNLTFEEDLMRATSVSLGITGVTQKLGV
jgi:hypothetical protein